MIGFAKGCERIHVMTVRVDNQTAIELVTNNARSNRIKHIGFKYHLIRSLVDGDRLQHQHCPTNEMVADIFIKPLEKNLLERFKKKVSVQ